MDASRPTRREQLRRKHETVQRVLLELGVEGLEVMEEWDGDDLEFLRKDLGEEQYQMLLDKLRDEEEREH